MLRTSLRSATLFSGIAALCLFGPPPVNAQMSLTSDAITAGFGLSTFVTGFPSTSNVGPVGITFTTGGGVLVADYPGNVRLFATDADGQTAASAVNVTNYGLNPLGMATAAGNYYLAQQTGGRIIQVNGDTSFNRVVVTGLNGPAGLISNPFTSHLLASINGSAKIVDIDPLTGVSTDVITGLNDVDGISLSADGSVVYAAVRGQSRLQGFNLLSHALVFDTSVPDLDGTAVGYGSLAGNIFANTTSGRLLEINLATGVQTVIGQNGSRGDFVTVDPNGTLLLTQTDRILRLTAPQGGGFGSVPEPGAAALLVASAFFGTTLMRRRRK